MLKTANKKRVRGVPVHYDEMKQPRTINLTDTAWQILATMADTKGLSRSEIIERLVRDLDIKKLKQERRSHDVRN